MDVNFGNMKRTFLSASIDHSDTFAYCGTKTGDVLEVIYINYFQLNYKLNQKK